MVAAARFGALEKKMHYGFIKNSTGDYIARVKDGKITSMSGDHLYSLVGDKIVADDGSELGYLSPFVGLTQGTDDLANQLFPARKR